MPSEKRALDSPDHDRSLPSSSSKRSKRDVDDSLRDWRAAHFDDGSSKRKQRDQRSRDRSLERDKDRHGRREDDRSRRNGHDHHGPSSSYRRDRHETDSLENALDVEKKSSSARLLPTAPKAMMKPSSLLEEREEGEISPRPSDTAMDTAGGELDLIQEKPVEDDGEARRARRAAILVKFQSSKAESSTPADPLVRVGTQPSGVDSVPSMPASTPHAANTGAAPSPAPFETENGQFMLSKESGTGEAPDLDLDSRAQADGGVEGVAAADYDPSKDMREDVRKAAQLAANDATMNDEESEYEEVDEENDDDIDDMFAIDNDAEKKPKKKKKIIKQKPLATVPDTMDAAADEEGYYQIILGEPLDGGRYKVFGMIGKGMFSNVVRARVYDPEGEDKDKIIDEVAIKIVRSQESMYRAGLKEAQILQKIRQNDPEDKKHLVRMERTFEHRGHLCLVFESLSMNLRDTVKKYGRDVGLHLKAVRVYAHQLFLALSLLRKCNILHADIKPDNILINESRSNLKLCDLGSAADISYENTAAAITPYLVSRFYRAPEIILGLPYDCAVDIWSMGCTLYELYTGRILFPGRSNREMLKLMMEVKGRFNQRVIKKAKFGEDYFDDGGGFWDMLDGGGADMSKKLHFAKATRDLRSRLIPKSRGTDAPDSDEKELLAFIDLLDKCLQLDSGRRITPKDALSHPFIRGIS